MRCTRCDRIAFEEILARDPDGDLVFGWCVDCVKEADFEIVLTPAIPLKITSEPVVRRLRHFYRSTSRAITRPRTEEAGKKLAAMGVVGLMTAWALILAFIAGVRLVTTDDGKWPWLVATGAMAVTSLIVWAVMIGRTGGFRIVLKVIQVAGAIAAFGILTWGILRDRREQAASIVLFAFLAFLVSWGARVLERRTMAPSKREQHFLLDSEESDDSTWDKRAR